MTEEEYGKLIDLHYASQSHKKVWNYFLALSKTEEFINFIADLRKRYKIPQNGFTSEDKISPPDQLENRFDNSGRISKKITEFCKKHRLHPIGFESTIGYYLYYNEKLEPADGYNEANLCLISDLSEESIEPFSKEIQDADNKLFPVAVRISPYATKRDIVDFINKTFKLHIKPMLDHYKEKEILIGKFKSRDDKVQKRNDFIYEHKDLPVKKISDLVTNKFGEFLDEGLISKIKSIEVKRRKEL